MTTWNSNKNRNNWSELEYFYQCNNKKMSSIFKLNLQNVYSAIIYGVLAIALYIIAQGSVFGLDWKTIVDVGILAILTSFVKNFLTTSEGKFANVVDTVGVK
jgi:glycyl-tRNA synthetase alpha subunit